MDPDELEFIGEKTTIGVIPNFNFEPIHLISGTIGPFRSVLYLKYKKLKLKFNIRYFRAGLPVHVPLWLAIHMRQQQKCRIVPPEWMDRDTLDEIKDNEKRIR
jgi:GINS complex subunit 2